MTTPKPKARKAACVFVVEGRKNGRWVPTDCASGSVRVVKRLLADCEFGDANPYRIRKYQRIDK